MSFILGLVDLLLLVVVLYDTLGFIVHNRKNPLSSNQQDYHRLCFTWIFYLAIRSLICSSCTGYIGSLLYLLSLGAKAYISLPMLHGTEKLYTLLVEQNVVRHYLEGLAQNLKQKVATQ
jgi:hypothetical protein